MAPRKSVSSFFWIRVQTSPDSKQLWHFHSCTPSGLVVIEKLGVRSSCRGHEAMRPRGITP